MERQKPRRDKIVVVGEGLVGSLLSILLARRGYAVDVYERRGDPRKGSRSAGRSINLALSTRGLYALKEAGVEEAVLKLAIPMRGRMVHAVSGKLDFQPYGRDDTQYINSVSRAALNAMLMDAAEATGRVRIRFGRRAVGLDLRAGVLKLESTRVKAKVVIAADGSGSAIRQDMMALPRYDYSQSHLAHGYKELTIPPGQGGSFQLEKNALHIWPRGSFMLIALPNLDASFTCTLFLPFAGEPGFDTLTTPAKVALFFKRQFPDAVPLMPGLTDEFFRNPTGSMVTVKCGRWNADGSALLIGDAAHAMVPFYGQGMNCGFEDCTILTRLLDERGPDWPTVFSEFSRLRKPDADAIADMAVENFIEMRDKVAQPSFLFEKKVEKLLAERFRADYVPRYSLVTFSRVPYRVAQAAGAAQSRILAELCRGLERPEDVDMEKAAELVRGELAPVMRRA